MQTKNLKEITLWKTGKKNLEKLWISFSDNPLKKYQKKYHYHPTLIECSNDIS